MKQFFRKKFSKLDLVVLRIVGIYFMFGLLWIFITNTALIKLASNFEQLSRFINYKDVAYISITTALLYLLFRKKLLQQSQIETSLRISEERWKFALEGSGDGVWDWNLVTGHVYRSARWKTIYGYSDNELEPTAEAGRKLIHPEDFQHAMADINAYLNGETDIFVSEFRLLCKDGSWKWTLSRGMVVSRSREGEPLRMIGTHADITARKQSEAQIIRLAHYDQLTGSPNRIFFLDRFKQDIKKAQLTDQTITLMYLDLDRFKEINDSLGHDTGDLLLRATAKRLKSCIRESDTIARLGGDEFTLILNNLENQASIERIAQEILDKLSMPFHLGNEVIHITTSIGISIYPQDGNDVELLLKNADQAMYAAKEHGRNRYHYFTPLMHESAMMRMQLINDLREAQQGNQFRIFYQPIVELSTGRIHKAEALIRWQHPSRGLVGPDEFIPIAEETGLIADIGNWVFGETSSQIAKWRLHYPKLQVSVNKSPVQFSSMGDNCTNWIEHLDSLKLTGESITIEITEGLLLDARDAVIKQLNSFRDAGISIAIDDFGTGYSSLAYLKKFDIDYIKIDRSFTKNIRTGSSDMVLCEAIIVMAHKLGMKVIAEGIETTDQFDLLYSAGCDYGQGYLYSEPVPADEFEKLLYCN